VKPRLEPIEHSADDRRADRIQQFLCLLDLVEIRASGADDQKDRVHHASKEQRVISSQDWRRVQEYEAELLRNDLNAGRALGQSTAPRNKGGLRPAGMKLTSAVFGAWTAACRIASAASA
jgi:hypothetical protein